MIKDWFWLRKTQKSTGYQRKGFFYVSFSMLSSKDYLKNEILHYEYECKLGLISYWLIYLIHGPDKLFEMSAETKLKRELNK